MEMLFRKWTAEGMGKDLRRVSVTRAGVICGRYVSICRVCVPVYMNQGGTTGIIKYLPALDKAKALSGAFFYANVNEEGGTNETDKLIRGTDDRGIR